MSYPHLLGEGRIAGMTVRNRIMLSAMGSMYANEDGTCGERVWDYYEARARGGAGLLILETSAAHWPNGANMPCTIGFSEDRHLPGLSTLVRRVQRHGARIAAQLSHSGKLAQEDVAAGRPVMVPAIPGRLSGNLMKALTRRELATFISAAGPDGKGPRYHPMTHEDIAHITEGFADAARRTLEAGFDAIELHAGHGYLIASFLSPFTNTRDDEYGGSVENRARLLVEIIRAVRAVVGADFPILVRLDACEFRLEGGITIDDAVATSRLAEQAGADAIDVSAYGNGLSGIAFTEAPLVHEPGGLLPFAHAVKAAVNVPVVGVGRIEPELAEREIARGGIDFVAMGRKLLADPDLPNKLRDGDAKGIRPCIYCYVCVSQIFLSSPMACAVNPATGHEAELDELRRADAPKRVAVVGGGPAGLEAARVLALRGHRVTLWERERDLGGTARIAALPYEPNGRLVRWLIDAVTRLPVEIRLRQTATLDALREAAPDLVIVATGARRGTPDIEGAQLDHVFDGDRLRGVLLGGDAQAARGLSAMQRAMVGAGRLTGITRNVDVLRRLSRAWMPLGRRVTLIGGGLVGLELAEYLCERGREVSVLEPSAHLGTELSVVRRARVLHMLRDAGVAMHTGVTVSRIDPAHVHYVAGEGAASVAADTVIISMGAEPDSSLVTQLATAGLEATAIGDCAGVGYIEGAMRSARRLAVAV